MDISDQKSAAPKVPKTPPKAYTAPYGHSLFLKKENNVAIDPNKFKRTTASKLPISIKQPTHSWKGASSSKPQVNLKAKTTGSENKTKNIQASKVGSPKVKEVKCAYLSNQPKKTIRTPDRCQRVQIQHIIGPDFSSKPKAFYKSEGLSSLNSAKPIPDLGTILNKLKNEGLHSECSKVSRHRGWFNESVDEYLTAIPPNTINSIPEQDYSETSSKEAINEVTKDPPTSDKIELSENNSMDMPNLAGIEDNANAESPKIYMPPDDKVENWLTNEAQIYSNTESGYRSMSPVTVKGSKFPNLADTIVQASCAQMFSTALSFNASCGEPRATGNNANISALTMVLEKPTMMCTIPKCKSGDGPEEKLTTNEGIATGASLGFNKNYQFPSGTKCFSECCCHPRSFVDCPSEVLQKTTNFETAVLGSSVHYTDSSSAMEVSQKENTSRCTLDQIEERSFGDDQSECHRTASSHSHSGPTDRQASDPNIVDTWDYRLQDRKDDTNAIFDNGETSEKSYVRRLTDNTTYTRLGLKHTPNCPMKKIKRKTLKGTYRSLRDYCSKFKANRSRSSGSRMTRLAYVCHRGWSNAIQKTAHWWLVFRKTRLRCSRYETMSYIQRTMLWEDVDVQTQMLFFRDTGTVMMKDQKSMAITTSLRLHSWLASYNKSHTGLQNKKINNYIKMFQQEYISRGPSMFTLQKTKTKSLHCTNNPRMIPTLVESTGIPLREYHSSPARQVPSFESHAKQTDRILCKDVYTSMDIFMKDKQLTLARCYQPIVYPMFKQNKRNSRSVGTEDLIFSGPACLGLRVQPMNTDAYTDVRTQCGGRKKNVIDTSYFTVHSYVESSNNSSGILHSSYDCKTGMYKPYMLCNKTDCTPITMNVATKPNLSSSFISFLKGKRRKSCNEIKPPKVYSDQVTQTPCVAEQICNWTNVSTREMPTKECAVITDPKNANLRLTDIELFTISSSMLPTPERDTSNGKSDTLSLEAATHTDDKIIGFAIVPVIKSAAVNTGELKLRQSIGLATINDEHENFTVLTMRDHNTGSTFVDGYNKGIAVQCNEPNLPQKPRPQLKSASINTVTTDQCSVAIQQNSLTSLRSNKSNMIINVGNYPFSGNDRVHEYRITSANTDFDKSSLKLSQTPTSGNSSKTCGTFFNSEASTTKTSTMLVDCQETKTRATSDTLIIKTHSQATSDIQDNDNTFIQYSVNNFTGYGSKRTVSQSTSYNIDTEEKNGQVTSDINKRVTSQTLGGHSETTGTSDTVILTHTQENNIETASKATSDSEINKKIIKYKNQYDPVLYGRVETTTYFNEKAAPDVLTYHTLDDYVTTNMLCMSTQSSHFSDKVSQPMQRNVNEHKNKQGTSNDANLVPFSKQCFEGNKTLTFLSVPHLPRKMREAPPKITKNATTTPVILVAQVSQALSAMNITPPGSKRCVEVQYSRDSKPPEIRLCISASMLTDANMKKSVGQMTNDVAVARPNTGVKSKVSVTVQCSRFPMRMPSSQRSNKIGRSQLMSVFSLCSSNREVATQYSITAHLEEPSIKTFVSDQMKPCKESKEEFHVTATPEDHITPTMMAAQGENYAFNSSPTGTEGTLYVKPKLISKALSSDMYAQRQRSSLRTASYDSKREPLHDPQMVCLSNMTGKVWSGSFEADSSSLNAANWIKRCGLPMDNEAYKDEQKELLEHFRKTKIKGVDSSQPPSVKPSAGLISTGSCKPKPMFNTESMEVTPPRSQILGDSFMRSPESLPEHMISPSTGSASDALPTRNVTPTVSIAFTTPARQSTMSQNNKKLTLERNSLKVLKEFQLQASPDICDAGTESKPVYICEVRDTRSASAITSRVVLPPCTCKHNMGSKDCVFVYDHPKCLIHHRSLMDASIQICPFNQDAGMETCKEHAVDEYVGSKTSVVSSGCCSGEVQHIPVTVARLRENRSNSIKLPSYASDHHHFSLDSDPSIDILRKALELSPKVYKALYETSKLLASNKCANAAVGTDNKRTTNLSTQAIAPELMSAGILTSYYALKRAKYTKSDSSSSATPKSQMFSPQKQQFCDTSTQPANGMTMDTLTQYSFTEDQRKTDSVETTPVVSNNNECGPRKEFLMNQTNQWLYSSHLNRHTGRVKDCLKKQIIRFDKDKLFDVDLSGIEGTSSSVHPATASSFAMSEPSRYVSSALSCVDICGTEKEDLNTAYHTLSGIEGRIRRMRSYLPK